MFLSRCFCYLFWFHDVAGSISIPPRMECWSIAGWPVAYTKVFLTGRRDPFILCLFCYFLYHLCFYFLYFTFWTRSMSTAISNRSLLLPSKLFQFFFSRRLVSTITSVDILLYQVNGAFRKPNVLELLLFTVSPCLKTVMKQFFAWVPKGVPSTTLRMRVFDKSIINTFRLPTRSMQDPMRVCFWWRTILRKYWLWSDISFPQKQTPGE